MSAARFRRRMRSKRRTRACYLRNSYFDIYWEPIRVRWRFDKEASEGCVNISVCAGSSVFYIELRLGNRRIFRVLRETHFPWSVFKGKTGFRLLSSRNDQRRRCHGPEDPILIYFQKTVNFPPKVDLSPRLYSHPLPSGSCTSYSKQPPSQPR